MADNKTPALPEGTDTVIPGAANTGGTVTIEETTLVVEREVAAPQGNAERTVSGSGNPGTGLAGSARDNSSSRGGSGGSSAGLTDRLRTGREKLASQAGGKARDFVSQGLERTAEALANVSRMVGDTAEGIDERLGEEYGAYARRAAGAIDNVANSIADKNPDELIDDTRTFVRNSPGIALAGAAVVGFVVARLIKSGIQADGDDEDLDDSRA